MLQDYRTGHNIFLSLWEKSHWNCLSFRYLKKKKKSNVVHIEKAALGQFGKIKTKSNEKVKNSACSYAFQPSKLNRTPWKLVQKKWSIQRGRGLIRYKLSPNHPVTWQASWPQESTPSSTEAASWRGTPSPARWVSLLPYTRSPSICRECLGRCLNHCVRAKNSGVLYTVGAQSRIANEICAKFWNVCLHERKSREGKGDRGNRRWQRWEGGLRTERQRASGAGLW